MHPLSPGRYKVQFTADTALKEKLELSRDLLRHAIPKGDLSDILNRALDLLIEDIMRRRFGKRQEKASHVADVAPSLPATIPTPTTPAPPTSCAPPHKPRPPSALDVTTATGRAAHRAVLERDGLQCTPPRQLPLPSPLDVTTATGRAAHRAVLERDGLQCTWRGPDGSRCTSRAWLERDHRHGRALGGPSNTSNLRHLCKAHNRRAAEHVYGTHHVERTIQREQMRRDQTRIEQMRRDMGRHREMTHDDLIHP